MDQVFRVTFGADPTGLLNAAKQIVVQLAATAQAVVAEAAAYKASAAVEEEKVAASAAGAAAGQAEAAVTAELVTGVQALVASLTELVAIKQAEIPTFVGVTAALQGETVATGEAAAAATGLAAAETAALSPAVLLGMALAALTAAAAGVVAVLGIVAAVSLTSAQATEDYGKEVIKVQRLMGGTAEEASGLAAVLKRYGVEVNALPALLRKFSKEVTDLAAMQQQGASAAELNGNALSRLGVQVVTATGQVKGSREVFLSTLDALSKIKDKNEQLTEAQNVFGRSYAQLMPLIAGGAEAFLKVEAAAKQYGLILTADNLDAVKKNVAAQKDMQMALQGLQVQIGNIIVPVLAQFAQAGDVLIQNFMRIIDSGKLSANTFQFIGDALKVLVDIVSSFSGAEVAALSLFTKSLNGVGEFFNNLGKVVNGVTQNWLASFQTLGRVVGDLLSRNFGDINKAIGDLSKTQQGWNKETAAGFAGMKAQADGFNSTFGDSVKLGQTATDNLRALYGSVTAAMQKPIDANKELGDSEPFTEMSDSAQAFADKIEDLNDRLTKTNTSAAEDSAKAWDDYQQRVADNAKQLNERLRSLSEQNVKADEQDALRKQNIANNLASALAKIANDLAEQQATKRKAEEEADQQSASRRAELASKLADDLAKSNAGLSERLIKLAEDRDKKLADIDQRARDQQRSYNDAILKGREDLARQLQNIEQSLGDKLEALAGRRVEINRTADDTIARIEATAADSRAKIEEDYANRITSINTSLGATLADLAYRRTEVNDQYNQKVTDAYAKAARARIDAEQKTQDAINNIQRKQAEERVRAQEDYNLSLTRLQRELMSAKSPEERRAIMDRMAAAMTAYQDETALTKDRQARDLAAEQDKTRREEREAKDRIAREEQTALRLAEIDRRKSLEDINRAEQTARAKAAAEAAAAEAARLKAIEEQKKKEKAEKDAAEKKRAEDLAKADEAQALEERNAERQRQIARDNTTRLIEELDKRLGYEREQNGNDRREAIDRYNAAVGQEEEKTRAYNAELQKRFAAEIGKLDETDARRKEKYNEEIARIERQANKARDEAKYRADNEINEIDRVARIREAESLAQMARLKAEAEARDAVYGTDYASRIADIEKRRNTELAAIAKERYRAERDYYGIKETIDRNRATYDLADAVRPPSSGVRSSYPSGPAGPGGSGVSIGSVTIQVSSEDTGDTILERFVSALADKGLQRKTGMA